MPRRVAEDRIEDAAAHAEQAVHLFRRAGQPVGLGFALADLGEALVRKGEPGRGRALLQEALTPRLATGSATTVGFSLNALGQLALDEGDAARAEDLFRQSVTKARLGADRAVIAASIEGLTRVATAHGDHHKAARLAAAATHLRATTGTHPPSRQQRLLADARRAQTKANGAADLDAASVQGAELAATEAWDDLLGYDEPRGRVAKDGCPPGQ